MSGEENERDGDAEENGLDHSGKAGPRGHVGTGEIEIGEGMHGSRG